MVRVDGDLTRMEGALPLVAAETSSLLAELLTEPQLAAFDAGAEVDFSFGWRDRGRGGRPACVWQV